MDNTKILEEFIQAAEQICEDLEINAEISTSHAESRLGFDFSARASTGPRGFDFWLREKTEKSTHKLTASLSVGFEEGAAPFYFRENIDYIVGHSDYLGRWATWAVFNFRQAHERTHLNSIFHESEIRVYGIPGYCEPAEIEANLLFHGILDLQEDKVLIYRFRHVEPPDGYLCRSFSYAVFVSAAESSPFWVVFPDFCGLEGGGSFRAYKHFEELIAMLKTKLEVEVRRFDIPYEELETFLLGHAEEFSFNYRETDLFNFYFYDGPGIVLKRSKNEFEKFKERFLKRDYPQALRDLRALVQEAEENLAKRKNIDYSGIQDPDVNKLAAMLIENHVIDGRLRPWFNAFTAVANISSHRNFPTAEDMKNEVSRTRIMLTFQIGFQLLEELYEPLRSKMTPIEPKFRISEE